MSRLSRRLLSTGGRCYYDLLGVARNATSEEIKAAFRLRAKVLHPDITSVSDPDNLEQHQKEFQELGRAYEVLRDTKKRRAYDNDMLSKGGKDQAHQHAQQHGTDDSAENRRGLRQAIFGGMFLSLVGFLATASPKDKISDMDSYGRAAPMNEGGTQGTRTVERSPSRKVSRATENDMHGSSKVVRSPSTAGKASENGSKERGTVDKSPCIQVDQAETSDKEKIGRSKSIWYTPKRTINKTTGEVSYGVLVTEKDDSGKYVTRQGEPGEQA